jgi:DNA invertase Pin-like site-specific DNA recombinase
MTNHHSTPRLGLYARISTKNNGQDPETQLVALRGYATARGFEIYQGYVDVGIFGASRNSHTDVMGKETWSG